MNTPRVHHRLTWIAGILALLAGLLGPGGAGAHAQISPGPLSKPHQSLGGVSQCTSCHKLGGGNSALKCLECHTEINQRLSANRGFHATVVKGDNPNKDCARCHSEHNGENFQLIHWEPSQAKFDHNKTGYVLEGKHAAVDCRQCHAAARVQADQRAAIREKDLNKTFLGLSRTCVSCHRDFHEGQLKAECQTCHNSTNWKDVSKFSHANTRYPLTGEHAKVACAKCHVVPAPGKSAKYKGINFSACAFCHADPHHGAFQKDCGSCHSTAGWKQLSTAGVNAQFDHDKTAYPLRGLHRTVSCAACHKGENFKAKVAHALCTDCHRPDPHSGQFAKRKDGDKCESCHTVEGFKPARFTVKDHATSGYPLDGKHVKVECAKCHVPAGKATRYKIKFAQCTDCHQDGHAGQFAAAPLLNRCESCHTVKGFAPATFTLARHKETKFPLTGAHIAVPCADCHAAKRANSAAPVPYHFSELSCVACHQDVHHGQFNEAMARKGREGRALGCEACHGITDWRDVSKFDHDRTAFRLTGAHKAVSCIQCHKPPNLETTMEHVSFKAAPKDCESCHEDPHARQFARNGQAPTCDQCHNTTKWKPSLFDHEKTVFSLKGAHQQVRCAACHKALSQAGGKQVLFYRPTPKECEACHGSKVPV